jgi:hypothetical protein
LAAFYVDFFTFVQFHCISLIIAFAFDDFKSLLQNFSLVQTSSKFQNFGLGNGERFNIPVTQFFLQDNLPKKEVSCTETFHSVSFSWTH